VAKAGGSSFNRILWENFEGLAHCEQFIESRKMPDGGYRRRLGNLDHLRRLDYISGHLPFPILVASELDLDDYLLCTILRHPFAQTMSHLNWVIKVSEDRESDLYKNVSANVQEISLTLRGVAEWTPDVVIYWLDRYANWFQNNQSRYFVPADQLVVNAVLEVLDRFALVGVTERIDAYTSRFSEIAGLPSPSNAAVTPHENRNAAYQVPLSLLDDPGLRHFLTAYNQNDMAVYDHAARVLAP
jgi:hypothetical protein